MWRALLTACLLAAILAPPVSAKGIVGIELCGADGCQALTLPPEALHEYPGGAGPSAVPPPALPFFEVKVTLGGTHWQSMWFVPTARLFALNDHGDVRWSGVWQRIDVIIARAAQAREPLRARAVAASIDGRRVAGDVTRYLELYRLGEPVGRAGSAFVKVRLKTEPQSPWALASLWFYPDAGVLQRGAQLVRLPPSVAGDLRAARPIGRESSNGFEWPLAGASLVVAAGFAAGGFLLTRRLPRTA